METNNIESVMCSNEDNLVKEIKEDQDVFESITTSEKVDESGNKSTSVRVSSEHLEAIRKLFKTSNPKLYTYLTTQLINTLVDGDPVGDEHSYMLSLLHGIEKDNAEEVLLNMQMVAAHSLCMDLMAQAKKQKHPDYKDKAINQVAKVMRAFNGHAETLRKFKSGGNQTIRVEKVEVNDGGQAIVGGINSSN